MTKTFDKIRTWITNNVKWSIGIGLLLMTCMVSPFVEREEETADQDIFIDVEDVTNNEEIKTSDEDEEQVKENATN